MGLNVWCYSGYSFEELLHGREEWRMLLENIDVLVDGRFVEELHDISLRFRGSSNQRIIDVPRTLKEGAIIPWKSKS